MKSVGDSPSNRIDGTSSRTWHPTRADNDLVSAVGIGAHVSYTLYVSVGAFPMQKKLTITVDEDVYRGLHRVIGRGKISGFIEELVRPHVLRPDLESAYAQMAKDRRREKEALRWAETPFKDTTDEAERGLVGGV